MLENLGREKPVTMDDIARAAGVHSRTVADALKGTGRVAPATRENVLRIAKSLNYVPNAAARALATGRTNRVAVLSNPLNDYYFSNAVQLLEAYLTKTGYEMALLHAHRDVEALLNATKASMVDGIIVLGNSNLKQEFLRRSCKIQPCVLVDTSAPDFVDHIMLDLRPAVGEALQMMIEAGRERVAFVANDLNVNGPFGMRQTKYLEVMKAAGRVPEFIDVDTHVSPDDRILAIKEYIQSHGCPDAMLCQNDETAIYTYRSVLDLGYRIPEDALLVGCDGLPFVRFLDTPLSTISLPMDDICSTASKFLQRRMANPSLPIQEERLLGKLVVRKSLLADAVAANG
jgi:DNA-binding LacI/PurR family transcriptional regulator